MSTEIGTTTIRPNAPPWSRLVDALQAEIRRKDADIEELRAEYERLREDALGEPRMRYVRVTLNGSHCVLDPSEGDCYVEEARNAGDPDWERYIVRDVWLSERELDDLPEFDGF